MLGHPRTGQLWTSKFHDINRLCTKSLTLLGTKTHKLNKNELLCSIPLCRETIVDHQTVEHHTIEHRNVENQTVEKPSEEHQH